MPLSAPPTELRPKSRARENGARDVQRLNQMYVPLLGMENLGREDVS